MIKALTFLGKNSSRVLLIGLLVALLLSGVSNILRPILPPLVSLVLGLAIARLNIREVFSELGSAVVAIKLLALIGLMIPITSMVIILVWRAFGLPEQYELLLLVFAAAPPLSSAASLSLLLGYNSRITLQVTLLAQLLTPLIGPLCFVYIDVPINIELYSMFGRIALMILGGITIGIAIQVFFGKKTIDHYPDAFNGVVVCSMVIFLLPLFDGVVSYVVQRPLVSVSILLLAVLLNLGSNLLIRTFAARFTNTNTANALGLMFGNRNIAIYFAVLPFNPLLSIFIAFSQIPMYATPALFLRGKN